MPNRRSTFSIAATTALSAFVFFIGVANCAAQSEIRSFRGRTMGTTYMVKVFGAEDLSDDIRFDIDGELRKVNDQMSTYLKSSEVSQFNASTSTEWFDVSRETAEVVEFAQSVSKATSGAFDITVGPSVNAWGFGPDERTGKPPEPERVELAKANIGFENLFVRLDPPALRKSIADLQIDLSAIAKGHGVDRVVNLLANRGAKSVFVEIGGEVRTSGDKAGEPWKVGIQTPDADHLEIMVAHPMGGGTGADESMATSGDYRNNFIADDVRYSHTIDPKTGKPIQNDMASVSVISESCMVADAWATALNVLGPVNGMETAAKENLNAFFVTREKDGFKTMGTGTLAQYAIKQVPAISETAGTVAAVGSEQATSLLPTVVAAALVMGIIVTGMAVGVMFGRKSISGSCGGIANQTNEDGSTSCALCSNPSDACKELREKMHSDSA